MEYRITDKNGHCILQTRLEKVARRFLFDNPERGYTLRKTAARNR